MDIDRRNLIALAAGASATESPNGGAAARPAIPAVTSMTAFVAAGLDPLTTCRRMLASADQSEGCYWLFTGPFPLEVEGVGPVYFADEETMRATRTEDTGRDGFQIHWREAGIIRDMQTGNIASSSYDPRTGLQIAHNGTIYSEHTRLTVSRSGDTLAFATIFPTAPVLGVTATAGVAGDRVCLTIYTRYKHTSSDTAAAHCSTLKIYSSLAELRNAGPSVTAQGFYSTRELDTGNFEVSGVMRKAKLDEKLNPFAWDRVRGFFPDFFDGDRIAIR